MNKAMHFNPSPAIGFLSVAGASVCTCVLVYEGDYNHLKLVCGSRELSRCHTRSVFGKRTLRKENGLKWARMKMLGSLHPRRHCV